MVKGIDYKFTATYTEDEKGHHHYWFNGVELIGCTSLLKKHHLAPNYDSVDEKILKQASDYGKIVHSELENYIKNDLPSFAIEVDNFDKWIKFNKLQNNMLASELKVNNDLVGGTIDFIYEDADGIVIADFKTTSQVHKDAVSWQLSIYRELLGLDIKKGVCFHIKNDIFEVIDIPLKTKEEVEKLFQCERDGELYQTNDLIATDSVEALVNLQMQLMAMEETKKQIETQMTAFKDYVLNEIEQRGLLNYKINCNGVELSLTRVLESKKESVDAKQLKTDMPELYEKYKKISTTKSYVKVSVKASE